MKKMLLIAALSVAGVASANDLKPVKNFVKTENAEKPEAKRTLCSTITIHIMCDGSQNFNNTYCWTEGNNASFQEALHCYETEHQMFNDELCN